MKLTPQPRHAATLALSAAMALPILAADPPTNPWPATGSFDFNCFRKSYFEPSGAVHASGFLWVVSDNGQIGRQRLGQDHGCKAGGGGDAFDSQAMPGKPDYESIAFVPDLGYLYLGIETDGSVARIVEYNPPAADKPLKDKNAQEALTGFSWNLDLTVSSSNGMEGMTFVPDDHHGYSTVGAPFNGLFFAATQKDKGKIYVYQLERPKTIPSEVPMVKHIHVIEDDLLPWGISDLYYSAYKRRLYVLYDEGDDKGCSVQGQRLQVLELKNSKWTQAALYAPVFGTSKTNAQMHGMEAVTIFYSDLYLGLDPNAKQAMCNNACPEQKPGNECDEWLNPIYRYTGF